MYLSITDIRTFHPNYISIWVFPKIMVPSKSSILIGFSIINHPFWGVYPYFWKHQFVFKWSGGDLSTRSLERNRPFFQSLTWVPLFWETPICCCPQFGRLICLFSKNLVVISCVASMVRCDGLMGHGALHTSELANDLKGCS